MDRLSVEDRVILWPDSLWPQEVSAVGVLDGRALLDPAGTVRLEPIIGMIEARLHRVPRLRQVLYLPPRPFGPPLWVDDAAFDVRDHVLVRGLPDAAGEVELLGSVEQIMTERLDRSRPLWQIWLLPGLSDGRIGLFVRLHHVMADGIAALATFGVFLDRVAGRVDPPARPWTPAPPPSRLLLLADTVDRKLERAPEWWRTVRHPLASARTARDGRRAIRRLLRSEPDPGTALDRALGPERALAVLRVDLDLVANIGRAHGATVNDVFLALVAGGVRGWLAERSPVPADLIMPMYVPKTLRTGDLDRARGNLIGQLVVPVPVGVADPGERLSLIAAETSRQKSATVPPLGDLLGTRAGRRAVLRLIERHPVSVTTADLIGPAESRFFAGAELLDVFPVLPLISRVTVGVGALSYAGTLGIAFGVDRATVPHPESLAAAAEAELATLSGRLIPHSRAELQLGW